MEALCTDTFSITTSNGRRLSILNDVDDTLSPFASLSSPAESSVSWNSSSSSDLQLQLQQFPSFNNPNKDDDKKQVPWKSKKNIEGQQGCSSFFPPDLQRRGSLPLPVHVAAAVQRYPSPSVLQQRLHRRLLTSRALPFPPLNKNALVLARPPFKNNNNNNKTILLLRPHYHQRTNCMVVEEDFDDAPKAAPMAKQSSLAHEAATSAGDNPLMLLASSLGPGSKNASPSCRPRSLTQRRFSAPSLIVRSPPSQQHAAENASDVNASGHEFVVSSSSSFYPHPSSIQNNLGGAPFMTHSAVAYPYNYAGFTPSAGGPTTDAAQSAQQLMHLRAAGMEGTRLSHALMHAAATVNPSSSVGGGAGAAGDWSGQSVVGVVEDGCCSSPDLSTLMTTSMHAGHPMAMGLGGLVAAPSMLGDMDPRDEGGLGGGVASSSAAVRGRAAGGKATRTSSASSSRKKKEFPCTFEGCTAVFGNRGHLQRHIRVHTKEKPYECILPTCTKRFSRRLFFSYYDPCLILFFICLPLSHTHHTDDNMMQHFRTHGTNAMRNATHLGRQPLYF